MVYYSDGKEYLNSTQWALYQTFNATEDWSKSQVNQLKYLFSGLPVIGNVIRTVDNWNYINDYLDNRGLSWSDSLYPTRMSGSGSLGNVGLNYVSSNIERLYK